MEAAALQDAEVGCSVAAEIEQILRDVAEDDGSSAALKSTKTDQAFTAADVEHCVNASELSAIEHSVSLLEE